MINPEGKPDLGSSAPGDVALTRFFHSIFVVNWICTFLSLLLDFLDFSLLSLDFFISSPHEFQYQSAHARCMDGEFVSITFVWVDAIQQDFLLHHLIGSGWC